MATPPLVQLGSDQGTVYDHMDFSIKSPTYAESYETGKKYADSMLTQPEDPSEGLAALNLDESWGRYDSELNAEFDKILNYGADIGSAGVDPMKGTDEASQQFRGGFRKASKKGKIFYAVA